MINKQQTEKKLYITLCDGIDYRRISKIMSTAGFQMNHATARNVLMSAMSNFLTQIGNEMGIALSIDKIEEILKDQEIHDAFTDILFKAYNELKTESSV